MPKLSPEIEARKRHRNSRSSAAAPPARQADEIDIANAVALHQSVELGRVCRHPQRPAARRETAAGSSGMARSRYLNPLRGSLNRPTKRMRGVPSPAQGNGSTSRNRSHVDAVRNDLVRTMEILADEVPRRLGNGDPRVEPGHHEGHVRFEGGVPGAGGTERVERRHVHRSRIEQHQIRQDRDQRFMQVDRRRTAPGAAAP